MGPGQPKPTRKRNRKRKRRVVSDSSSSEDDSSSSSSDASTSTPQKTVTIPVRQPKPATSENADVDEDEDEVSSSSSDESQDDSAPGEEDVDISVPSSRPGHPEPPPQRDSPSPQPNVDIPPFIPQNAPESEQALKEKFRKFWMASIAEGFKDDLEEIRKVRVPLEGPGNVSGTERVHPWVGTESWPVTAGAPHRVACFRCRRVFIEFWRWWCERDGSRVGPASIVPFFNQVLSS